MNNNLSLTFFSKFIYYFKSFSLSKKERHLLYSIYKKTETISDKDIILNSIPIFSKYKAAFKFMEQYKDNIDIQLTLIKIISIEKPQNLWGLFLNLNNLNGGIMNNDIFYFYISSIKKNPLKEIKEYLTGYDIHSDNIKIIFITHLFKTDSWNILRNISKKFPDIIDIINSDNMNLFIKLNSNESKLFLHAFDSMKGNIKDIQIINKIFSLLNSKNFNEYLNHLSYIKFTTYLTLANIFKALDKRKRNTIIEAFEYSFFLKLLIRLEFFYINNPMHLNYFVYFFRLDIEDELKVRILGFFKYCFDLSFSLGIDIIKISFRELYHNDNIIMEKLKISLDIGIEKEFIFLSKFINIILNEYISIDSCKKICELLKTSRSEYEFSKLIYVFEKFQKISGQLSEILILSINKETDLIKLSKYAELLSILEKNIPLSSNFKHNPNWFKNAINMIKIKLSNIYNIPKKDINISLEEMIFLLTTKINKKERKKISELILSDHKMNEFSSKILSTIDIPPLKKVIDPAELTSNLILGLLLNQKKYNNILKLYFSDEIIKKIKNNVSIKKIYHNNKIDIEYLKFCYEPAVKKISEYILEELKNIKPLVMIIENINLLYNNNIKFFNKLSIKIQSMTINDISDNTKFMCPKFYPTGKQKEASIIFFKDNNIHLLHIIPNIDIKYFYEPIGVIICCICNDIENNKILLIDSIEGGIEFKNVPDNLKITLIINSIKEFNKIIRADTILFNESLDDIIKLKFNTNFKLSEFILTYNNKTSKYLNTFKNYYKIEKEPDNIIIATKIKGYTLKIS